MSRSADAMIAGVGQTRIERHSDRPDEEWLAEAIRLALDDAGLRRSQVDGLAVGTISIPDDTGHIAEHLGFELSWAMKADFGGASTLIGLARARDAIRCERADVVVVAAGGNRLDSPSLAHDRRTPPLDYSLRNYAAPFGYAEPNGFFALLQQRHMHEHGTTLDQLGKIATTFRSNAMLNEDALLQEPMSLEDYLGSRLIADPIRRADCVMRCAGGAAIVLVSERVAVELERKPVHLGAYGERIAHQTLGPQQDRLEMGFAAFAAELFARTPRDAMDFAQLYDDYPIAVIMMLESLGFAERGGGGRFIEDTDISLGGELPLNTGGGQLSIGQPSLAGGALHLVEAVRQLRGEAGLRQLPDPEVGLVTGIGMLSVMGNVTAAAGLIVGKEAFA